MPPSVALDRTLTKPVAGDTAATQRARAELARIDRNYATANQLYDQASAQADAAAVDVVRARKAATGAAAQAESAHAEFAALITAQYQGSGTPVGAGLLSADGQTDFLAKLDMERSVALHDADVLAAARRSEDAARAARQRLEDAQTAAEVAQDRANAELVAASRALSNAQDTVAHLHSADLAAAASARESTIGAAAAALQAEALASGAAAAQDFATAAAPAQVIAIATRALLERAAAHPKAAVTGATPDLGGTVPYTGTTGAGPVRALTPFDGTVSTSGWPNAGVGTALKGTAPFQQPGPDVHPELPAYPDGYVPLRAEVAVDAALEQLGSPYVWDAAGPDTFDCSGLTLWAWGDAGVELSHYTGDQVNEGLAVTPDELLPGDLLFFGRTVHHVGMYLGAGYMIDAPTTGDYVKVQLVSDDGDFTVAVRP